VEFALVFPLFLTAGLALLDLVFFEVRQIYLAAAGREIIRRISRSDLKTEDEMEKYSRDWFEGKWARPDRITVEFEVLPVQKALAKERKKKTVRIIRLKMEGRFRPGCVLLLKLLGNPELNWRFNERGVQVN